MRARLPADFPPTFTTSEVLDSPSAPRQDRIEVGVLVVGAGPAGLACAIRLEQLLEETPAVAKSLGDVPVAILEKGKQPGSHLLSGAIVDPRPFERLFAGRESIAEMPFFGRVAEERLYLLTPRHAMRIPAPPLMRNEGNYVASLSRIGRWLGTRAEEAGALVFSETAATTLLVQDGKVVGVRTGDKGLDRSGRPGPRFEPGSEISAAVTVLAEGTTGHLANAAITEFGLQGANPQVWSLGVKEVWKVARPLDHVIHTLGWPLRTGPRAREFGGSFVYPMGDNMIALGMVVGLDYRDAELSVHDLLQELKTHRLMRPILEGGERLAWGAKTIPEGGFYALPKSLHVPGLLLVGDAAGMVNVPAVKGVHYAVESGILAAESIVDALSDGRSHDDPAALERYDRAVRDSFIWRDLYRVRNVRQAMGHGLVIGGAGAAAILAAGGWLPRRRLPARRDAEAAARVGSPHPYPEPDGRLTFDKLSSVYVSGNKTDAETPDSILIRRRVPLEVATTWARMCPAQVYEFGREDAQGMVDVEITPSNCVQCGAINAKGGRLVPPEGGSGPEYSIC